MRIVVQYTLRSATNLKWSSLMSSKKKNSNTHIIIRTKSSRDGQKKKYLFDKISSHIYEFHWTIMDVCATWWNMWIVVYLGNRWFLWPSYSCTKELLHVVISRDISWVLRLTRSAFWNNDTVFKSHWSNLWVFKSHSLWSMYN